MSWRVGSVVALGVIAGVLLARAAQDADAGTASWDALRAAGFAAYLLLWLSVVTGMAVHMRYRPAPVALSWLLETHRMASVLSLAFLAGHLAGLLVDPTVAFSPIDLAVGVTAGYRPLQLGLGALAMWGTGAVLASTAAAAQIRYALWRNLHYLAFPAYVLALAHGITAGTDSAAPLALGLYAATAAVVAAMLVARILGRGWVEAGEPA